ncbi:uncharacterized protein TNCV_4995711 [Trichonephila clavipes]|nr:uncharacterized protein TNCV_4995711 [Trichonephila clavipes]
MPYKAKRDGKTQGQGYLRNFSCVILTKLWPDLEGEKDFNDGHREEDEEDVETWMACDAEDCGFQMLNDDEIVTSVQESDSVDDEADENEDNNNETSKGPSNADAFSALETAME